MIKIERMKAEHLQQIYDDPLLKPCILVAPVGRKFGAVLCEDEALAGAVTGFTEGNTACIQSLLLKQGSEAFLYKDALVRAFMHFTELEGCKYLLVPDEYFFDLKIPYATKNMAPVRDAVKALGIDTSQYTLIDSELFFKKGGC